MEKFIFYLFGAIVVAAALRVITARNPVHAALFLVLTFFSSAAIWLLLRAEFLGIALILVYVGAVMVLFLFVVMMLDINVTPLSEGFASYLPIGIVVGLLIFIEMFLVLYHHSKTAPEVTAEGGANAEQLGEIMFTQYLYPFEIAAAILLVAMVAAIALTMRAKRHTKYIPPEQQINVRREERVRLVSMPAEQKD